MGTVLRRYDLTDPYWHQCPTCGAEPGVACMDRRYGPGPGRRFLDWFHRARIIKAEAVTRILKAEQLPG